MQPRLKDHFNRYAIPGLHPYAKGRGERLLFKMEQTEPLHAQRYTRTHTHTHTDRDTHTDRETQTDTHYFLDSILMVPLNFNNQNIHSLSLFSMGTVRADTALFGQPVLVISARLYSQSMVAHTHTQSPHCHEDHVSLCSCVSVSQVYLPSANRGPIIPPRERLK